MLGLLTVGAGYSEKLLSADGFGVSGSLTVIAAVIAWVTTVEDL
jgi:hypothetical protein